MVDQSPVALFAGLKELHGIYTTGERELRKWLGTPICIGCGGCCSVNTVQIRHIEAAYGVSALLSEGRLSQAVKIAEGWLTERDSHATLYEGMPSGSVTGKLKEEYDILVKSQCPFLDSQTKRCLVYEARPLTCRAYGIFRQQPVWCPRPLSKLETPENRAVIWGEGAQKFKEVIDEFIKRLPPGYGVSGLMPTMLLRAAKPDRYHALIYDNKIASAKLVGRDISPELIWQDQLEDLFRNTVLVA